LKSEWTPKPLPPKKVEKTEPTKVTVKSPKKEKKPRVVSDSESPVKSVANKDKLSPGK